MARRPEPSPVAELYVGLHPGLEDSVEIVEAVPEPDLVIEFSMCREHGRSLFGPEPAELIGPVPFDWVLDTGDRFLKRWQSIDFEQQYAELMVFTACRLWRLSAEGTHCSKSEAAAWVVARGEETAAARAVLARRATPASDSPAQGDVMALLVASRRAIARAG